MFTSSSALQDRRGTSKSLGVDVLRPQTIDEAQGHFLPPLKSPRGHLLDRIRSTPRSSKFVPQSAPASSAFPVKHSTSTQHTPQQPLSTTFVPSVDATSSATRTSNIYTPRRTSASQFHQTQNLAKSDQLALLEQQLRSQNDLLAQQQVLLQQLQLQGHQNVCATPPYTPKALGQRQAQMSQANNNVVYDPTTGQYYMFTPQAQPTYLTTPVTKPSAGMYTPESISRTSRSVDVVHTQTPPKSTQASRQPSGPPAIELLISDQDGSLNFGSRSRKRATQVLEAGLLRRRNSPVPGTSSRPTSRASSRSNSSLGPIDEAFPAISL